MGDSVTSGPRLRLDLTAQHWQQLVVHPALGQLAKGPSRRLALRATFFDTADHKLYRHGIFLSVHRQRSQWRQTVRWETGDRGNGSGPMEIETKIGGAAPDLTTIKGRAGDQLRDIVRDSSLHAHFETNVRRCEYLLGSADGGLVTLLLDETSIQIETGIIDSLCAEFALVSGNAGSILFVAEALFAEVGFRFGIESDAARAVRLMRDEEELGPSPEKSVAEPLLPGQISTEAFASVCRSAARQILHNWQVVLESSDPEGPHQMRIGLRRLRTALRVFRPVFDSEALRQLARELRDIAQLVGEVRDLDVLATDIVGPVAIRNADRMGFQTLQRLLLRKAARHRTRLQRNLADRRWSPLRLRLVLLPDGACWTELAASEPALQRVELLAALALEECWRRVKRYTGRLSQLSMEERHELRKRLKALRYAAEFFVPLYPATATARFVKRLRRTLDIFGYLNDVAMAETLMALSHAEPVHDADRDTAAGFVLGWHSARAERAWDEVPLRLRQLKRSAHFWR